MKNGESGQMLCCCQSILACACQLRFHLHSLVDMMPLASADEHEVGLGIFGFAIDVSLHPERALQETYPWSRAVLSGGGTMLNVC